MELQNKKSTVKYKLLYTAIILLVYLLGRGLPMYGVDASAYENVRLDADNLFAAMVGGDISKISVFSLGIYPYMFSSIIVQIFLAIRKSDKRANISPRKSNYITLAMFIIIATVQACFNLDGIVLQEGIKTPVSIIYVICIMEMITGAFIIVWLIDRNKRYGIGGQSIIIFVNITDGVIKNLQGHNITELAITLGISVVFMLIMIIMEYGEKRIPMQRISIHNIYSDKNYMPIKLNPIGIMPVMFSTVFFMIPKFIVYILLNIFPDSANLQYMEDNLKLTEPLGIGVYIFLVFVLTIGFSLVFINPGRITEQFLKSGDCLTDIHPGKQTKGYLRKEVLRISTFSATVIGTCLLIPLVMQLTMNIDNTLAMLPSSFMMQTGIWTNIIQEYRAVKSCDSYTPFI